MNKFILTVFSLVALLLSCTTAFSCPIGDDCPATEIAVDSFGISGHVVLIKRGRERNVGHVEVDTFEFRQGEWQPMGTIIGENGFGWKSNEVSRYKFVVRHEGFKATTLIVNVRNLKGKWNVFIVPLKADGCGRARLIRLER